VCHRATLARAAAAVPAGGCPAFGVPARAASRYPAAFAACSSPCAARCLSRRCRSARALASAASIRSSRVTGRREGASSTLAKNRLPSPVTISVPSPNHFRLTAPARKSRPTRSGARHRPFPGRVADYRQLGILPPQPHQLGPLIPAQLPVPGVPPPPVRIHPVAQRALVDTQLPGHLRDRLTGLPDQPHRALLKS